MHRAHVMMLPSPHTHPLANWPLTVSLPTHKCIMLWPETCMHTFRIWKHVEESFIGDSFGDSSTLTSFAFIFLLLFDRFHCQIWYRKMRPLFQNPELNENWPFPFFQSILQLRMIKKNTKCDILSINTGAYPSLLVMDAPSNDQGSSLLTSQETL